MQTNLWIRGKEHVVIGEAKFDPELIDHCLAGAAREEELWLEFFTRNELNPLALTYEELCADYPETVKRVFDFLRIRPRRNFDWGSPRTERQADALTEEWANRYRALRESGP